jgi:hypothetical protein
VLIHIGYHKTGTTFLQSGLFASSDAGFASPWPHVDLRNEIVLCSDFDWDASAVHRRFQTGRETASLAGLVPVMSDERLSGSAHAGGYDSARTAHRLAEAFPDARILIGVREQADAIYSTYQQYVRNGGGATAEKYMQPRHQAEMPQFRFEHWEYDRLIALYQGLFSPDRVLVLPYELLRTNPQDWADRIRGLVGMPSAPLVEGDRYRSLSAMGIAAKRQANRFLFRGALNPAAPLYVKNLESRFERLDHLWPERWSARIQDRTRAVIEREAARRYGRSNRETATLTGLALGPLGYNLESE